MGLHLTSILSIRVLVFEKESFVYGRLNHTWTWSTEYIRGQAMQVKTEKESQQPRSSFEFIYYIYMYQLRRNVIGGTCTR